jgi:hypothetical protein
MEDDMFFRIRNTDRITKNILDNIDQVNLHDPIATSIIELSLRNPTTHFSQENCNQLTNKLVEKINTSKKPEFKFSYASMLANLYGDDRPEDWIIPSVSVITTFVSAAKSITKPNDSYDDSYLAYDYAAHSISKHGIFKPEENIVLAQSIFNTANYNEKTLRGQSALFHAFRKNTDARSFDFKKSPEIKELIINAYNQFSQSKLDVINISSSAQQIRTDFYISKIRSDLLDFIN